MYGISDNPNIINLDVHFTCDFITVQTTHHYIKHTLNKISDVAVN